MNLKLGNPQSQPQPSQPQASAVTGNETSNNQMTHFLIEAASRKASDLFLKPDTCMKIKINGSLSDVSNQLLTPMMIDALLRQILPVPLIKQMESSTEEIDYGGEIPGHTRYRLNIFRSLNAINAVFRLIPLEIPTLKDLKLPAALIETTKENNGLVLICGPTGSGKTTTLAALINHINATHEGHIITIEDPVEFRHQNQKCIVSHREVGPHKDSPSFASALKAALRQAPNYILVGEMRDSETMQAALTAAETGHLVYATVHTNSAIETIGRIIASFPTSMQAEVRARLANTLRYTFIQRLAKGKTGRVMVYESLISDTGVKNNIREGQEHQIKSALKAFVPIEQTAAEAVRRGEITLETAITVVNDVEDLKKRGEKA